MSYLKKLANLIEESDLACYPYGVSDDNDKLISGTKNGGYQIRVIDEKWHVRDTEWGRADIYEDIVCSDEQEACRRFIKMTEKYLHLSKYLPEFEE